MAKVKKTKHKAEFGDFQTPIELAGSVCRLLFERGLRPRSILEPTCGLGSFLVASIEVFPNIQRAVGVEINPIYAEEARRAVTETGLDNVAEVLNGDFFNYEWTEILSSLPDPLLIIGNPPWVTNAELGSLASSNLPRKSNFQNHRGIDAITGKSNFDISEWMLIRSLEWIKDRGSTLAMLCKTAVARKVLFHAWKIGIRLDRSDIYLIDAIKEFEAAVDACLLVVETSLSNSTLECQVHNSLEHGSPRTVLGYRNNHLVSDVNAYERLKGLEGQEWYQWRSGIKHDCSKVMEFVKEANFLRNGLGEIVDIEDNYLYPMLKSADVANGSEAQPKRWMLVTQRFVGENTSQIRDRAPKTWRYLEEHADFLDRRTSSIYRKKPRFSIFGVGNYSFTSWKVAISGFYKKLDFKLVGPHEGKAVVLDDTCYFLACDCREEAQLLAQLLNSDTAKEFFSALVFWDAKRPITVALLRRLDVFTLAQALGVEAQLEGYLKRATRSSVDTFQPELNLSMAKH
jgi:hypothetical protein